MQMTQSRNGIETAFGFTESDIERRLRFVNFQHDDIARLTSVRPLMRERVDDYVAAFFDYLAGIEEATELFNNPHTLQEAKHLKREHLSAMVSGDYGKRYVDERIRLATLYGRVGLDIRVFLGAYHYLMTQIGNDIIQRHNEDRNAAFKTFISLKKIAFFDMAIIIDVMLEERERTIIRQQEAIRELSTPVLQLSDGLLLLPLIGVLNTERTRQLTTELLTTIRKTRARVVVMDVTGVAAMDSVVAQRIAQSVAAARLMGASVIMSGLSPSVAQALAVLGIELSGLETAGDLQSGVERAQRHLGYKLVKDAA
jgi:rsbT co-antagonist protein RsbR